MDGLVLIATCFEPFLLLLILFIQVKLKPSLVDFLTGLSAGEQFKHHVLHHLLEHEIILRWEFPV
jgi:hypothetical protein